MTTKQCKSMQFNRLFRFSKGDIMRINLTVAMLTLCCVQLSASNLYGQRISLNVSGAPFTNVLRSIEKQSGYTFFYKMRDINAIGPITIVATDEPINQLLDKLLDRK